MLRESQPDLVVTNVFLRGISGHDAMYKIKNSYPELPVLMVSGLPDHDVISEWTGQTGFDIFPKPFTCESLTLKVNEMLRSKQT